MNELVPAEFLTEQSSLLKVRVNIFGGTAIFIMLDAYIFRVGFKSRLIVLISLIFDELARPTIFSGSKFISGVMFTDAYYTSCCSG